MNFQELFISSKYHQFWLSYGWFSVLYDILLPKPVISSWNRRELFDLSQVSKREQIGSILTCPKLAKYQLWTAQSQQNNQIENLYISSHREARNIKFRQQVNIIEGIPLGTPPLAVVTTLAHNHVTNLFILSYRGITVIKFGL